MEVEGALSRLGASERMRQDVLELVRTDLVEIRVVSKAMPAMFGPPTPSTCLTGTLGINYHGTPYNIPCEIYLLPGYPRDPPRFAVVPTKDMLIRSHHDHVNAAGAVRFEYLTNFNPSSSLVEMCTIASSIFGNSPPLFSKPPASSGDPQPQQERPPSYASLETPKDRLTSKLQMRLRSYFESERRSIDVELAAQAKLERASAKLKGGSHVPDLNTALTQVSHKATSLDAWLNDHRCASTSSSDNNNNNNGNDDSRVHIVADDAVSRQLLANLAESNAIDDVLFTLDEFLYHGQLDVDTLLRDVRRLSNAQFKLKAHVCKILSLLQE